MNIRELLAAIDDAIECGWITPETEVTIEMPIPGNDQHHIHKEFAWNVYFMLDHVFSLTVGEKFSELEYDEPAKELSMEDVELVDMRAKYQAGEISQDEYKSWLTERMEADFNED